LTHPQNAAHSGSQEFILQIVANGQAYFT